MNIDFTQLLIPYIIPYQLLTFWTGTWKPDMDQNALTFKHLILKATGLTFDYSDLTIELFNVTLERLLQQGTTNVTTFDCEDRHMYITLADRDYKTYQVSSLQDVAPDKLRCPTHTEWNSTTDSYTKIAQIPPNMAWTRRFVWPQLGHGYLWDIGINIDDHNGYCVLMPGAQGIEQVNTMTKVTLQNEIITNHIFQANKDRLTGSTIWPRVSYPRMHITHPWVPDEAGYMRFRYIIRMSAQTHVRIHLVPDHINPLPDHINPHAPHYWRRQVLFMPIITNEDARMKTVNIPCLPYEIGLH